MRMNTDALSGGIACLFLVFSVTSVANLVDDP
jgi:hypothetical protein